MNFLIDPMQSEGKNKQTEMVKDSEFLQHCAQ